MLETSGLNPTDENNQLEMRPSESGYKYLSVLAQWIEDSLELPSGEMGDRKLVPTVKNIVDQVGNCLPIESGAGHATIQEQLIYWAQHQQLFRTAQTKHLSAVDLITSRHAIISQLWDKEQQIIDIHKSQIPYWLGGFRKKRLESEIQTLKANLASSDNEFVSNKQLYKEITSQIDCKLPTVVAGKILEKMGWGVSLVCANYPEHPSLLTSKVGPDGLPVQLLIDFNSSRKTICSEPIIRDEQVQRFINFGRTNAIKLGFITEQDPWPLPFNEESFSKFDKWFVDHVEKGRE